MSISKEQHMLSLLRSKLKTVPTKQEENFIVSAFEELLTLNTSQQQRLEILQQLTCEEWLTLIKIRPKWWIFRGPFSTEMYKEDYREQLILFLVKNPDLADLYFNDVAWETSKRCQPIREILMTDPRIIALRMAMI